MKYIITLAMQTTISDRLNIAIMVVVFIMGYVACP